MITEAIDRIGKEGLKSVFTHEDIERFFTGEKEPMRRKETNFS